MDRFTTFIASAFLFYSTMFKKKKKKTENSEKNE